jgi:hypothetical protein
VVLHDIILGTATLDEKTAAGQARVSGNRSVVTEFVTGVGGESDRPDALRETAGRDPTLLRDVLG